MSAKTKPARQAKLTFAQIVKAGVADAVEVRMLPQVELRQGNRAQPIAGQRRQDPKFRGGRNGGKANLRKAVWA